MKILQLCLAIGVGLGLSACESMQQSLLFHPTHDTGSGSLAKWAVDGRVIGYCREVAQPKQIWLMLHGNGGQAMNRVYAMHLFSPEDSVFILEYPGYGTRRGNPSKRSIDAAATEAYWVLRRNFPTKPICVAGESLGSGPACMLANESQPPDKIVLVVPFDDLARVGAEYVPNSSAKAVLGRTWDNVRSLANYHGPVEIFGAERDRVIPIGHARALAASVPQAKFHLIPGDHNDWSWQSGVEFRYP